MTAAKKILDDALALPADERRRVGEQLLESVRESPEDVEAAWDREVLRRLETAEESNTHARSWNDVSAELRAKFAASE